MSQYYLQNEPGNFPYSDLKSKVEEHMKNNPKPTDDATLEALLISKCKEVVKDQKSQDYCAKGQFIDDFKNFFGTNYPHFLPEKIALGSAQ